MTTTRDDFEPVTAMQVTEGKKFMLDSDATLFCLASIAISLKRIADALEPGQTGVPINGESES